MQQKNALKLPFCSRFLVLSLFLILAACKTETPKPRIIERGKIADSIMVVSAREEASRIGAEIEPTTLHPTHRFNTTTNEHISGTHPNGSTGHMNCLH